jgi:hypothetical protein
VDVQQQQCEKKKEFAIVSTDESFFFYDSLARRVWIARDKRPVVKVTGSHQYSCLFGAASMDGIIDSYSDSTINSTPKPF